LQQTGPGSNPNVDTANQAVHPSGQSGVGKLVAISIQQVTTVDYCKGKHAAVQWQACSLSSRRCKVPHIGFLQSLEVVLIRHQIKSGLPLPYIALFSYIKYWFTVSITKNTLIKSS
jgi:hypothetical protein